MLLGVCADIPVSSQGGVKGVSAVRCQDSVVCYLLSYTLHADMGNGRYSDKLTYEQWYK